MSGEAVLVSITLESNEPGSITQNELKAGQDWGQTFSSDSAAATYPVDRLEVMLSRDSDNSASNKTITVSLRDSFDGTVLGSNTISSNSLTGSEEWYSFDIGSVSLNDNTTDIEAVPIGPDRNQRRG